MNFTWCALFLLTTPVPLILSLGFHWSWLLSYLSYLISALPPTTYDYIVIGAGSAGYVVAFRLLQAGHQVVLIEAGGPAPILAHIPGYVPFLQKAPYDWAYKTEVQERASLSAGGNSLWPGVKC